MLTLPEEKHLQILLRHKHIYDLFEKTGELVGFHHDIQAEVVEAYRVEHPHYHYNNRCRACILEMIHTIYSWYKSKVNG